MTMNGVMTIILHYFSEFGIAFGGHCVKVIENIPKLSATGM